MRGWSLTNADGESRLSIDGQAVSLSGVAGPAFEQELIKLVERSDRVRYSTFSSRMDKPGPLIDSILDAPKGKDFKMFFGKSEVLPSVRNNPRAYVYTPDRSGEATTGRVQHGDQSYAKRAGPYVHDKLGTFEVAGQKLGLVLTANATDSGFGHAERKDRVSQENVYKFVTDPAQVAQIDQYLKWKFNEDGSDSPRPKPMQDFVVTGPGVDLSDRYASTMGLILDAGNMYVASANIDESFLNLVKTQLEKHPNRHVLFEVNVFDEVGNPLGKSRDQVSKISALARQRPGQVIFRTSDTFKHYNLIAGDNTNLVGVGGVRLKSGFVFKNSQWGNPTDVAYIGEDQGLAKTFGSRAELSYLERASLFFDKIWRTAEAANGGNRFVPGRTYSTGYVKRTAGGDYQIPKPAGVELLTPSNRSQSSFELIFTLKSFHDTSAHTYNLMRFAERASERDPGFREFADEARYNMEMSDQYGTNFIQNYLKNLAGNYVTNRDGQPVSYEVTQSIRDLDLALGRRTWGASGSFFYRLFDELPSQMGTLGVMGQFVISRGRKLDRFFRFSPETANLDADASAGPFETLAKLLHGTIMGSVAIAGLFALAGMPALKLSHEIRGEMARNFENAQNLEGLNTGSGAQRVGRSVASTSGTIGSILMQGSSGFANRLMGFGVPEILGRFASIVDTFSPNAGMKDAINRITQIFSSGNSFATNLVNATTEWNTWVENKPMLRTVTHTERGVMGIFTPFIKEGRYKGLVRLAFPAVMLASDFARHGSQGGRVFFSSVRDATWTGLKELAHETRGGRMRYRGFPIMVAYAAIETATSIIDSLSPAGLFLQIAATQDTQTQQLAITKNDQGRADVSRFLLEKTPGQVTLARNIYDSSLSNYIDQFLSLASYPMQRVIASAWNLAEQQTITAPFVGAGAGILGIRLFAPRSGRVGYAAAAVAGAVWGLQQFKKSQLFPQKENRVYAGYSTEAISAVSYQAQALLDLAIRMQGGSDKEVQQLVASQFANVPQKELQTLVANIQDTFASQGVEGIQRLAHQLGQKGMYQISNPLQRELGGRSNFALNYQIPLPVPFIATYTMTRVTLGDETHYSTTLQGPVNIQIGFNNRLPMFFKRSRTTLADPKEEALRFGAVTGMAALVTSTMFGFRAPFSVIAGGLVGGSAAFSHYLLRGTNQEGGGKPVFQEDMLYEGNNFLEALLLPLMTLKTAQLGMKHVVAPALSLTARGLGLSNAASFARLGQASDSMYRLSRSILTFGAAPGLYIGRMMLSGTRSIAASLVYHGMVGKVAGQEAEALRLFNAARSSALASERAYALDELWRTGGISSATSSPVFTHHGGRPTLAQRFIRAIYGFQEISEAASLAAEEAAASGNARREGYANQYYDRTVAGVVTRPLDRVAPLRGFTARASSFAGGALAVGFTLGIPAVAAAANYFYRERGGMQAVTDRVVSAFSSFGPYVHSAARYFATQVFGINMPTSREEGPWRLTSEPSMIHEMRSNAWKNTHSAGAFEVFRNQLYYSLASVWSGFYHAIESTKFIGLSSGGGSIQEIGGKTYYLGLSDQHMESMTAFFAQNNLFSWIQGNLQQMSVVEGTVGVKVTANNLEASRRIAATARRQNPITTLKRFVRSPARRMSTGQLYNEQMGLDQMGPAAEQELARRRNLVSYFLADPDNARILGYFSNRSELDERSMQMYMPFHRTGRSDNHFYLTRVGFKRFTEDLRAFFRSEDYNKTGESSEFSYDFSGDGEVLSKPKGETLESLVGEYDGYSNVAKSLATGLGLLTLSGGLAGLYFSRNARIRAVGGTPSRLSSLISRFMEPQSSNGLFFTPYFWDPESRGTTLSPSNPAGATYRNFWQGARGSSRAWTFRIGQGFYTFGGADLHLTNPRQRNVMATVVDPTAPGGVTTTSYRLYTPNVVHETDFFRAMTVLEYDSDLRRLPRAAYSGRSSSLSRSSYSILNIVNSRVVQMRELHETIQAMRAHSVSMLTDLSGVSPSNPLLEGFSRAHHQRVSELDRMLDAFDRAPTAGSLSITARLENLEMVSRAIETHVNSHSGLAADTLRQHMTSMTVNDLLSSTGSAAALPHELPGLAAGNMTVSQYVQNQMEALREDAVRLRGENLPERLGYSSIFSTNAYRYLVQLSGGGAHILASGLRDIFAQALASGWAGIGVGEAFDGNDFYRRYMAHTTAGQLSNRLVTAVMGGTPAPGTSVFGAAESAAMHHLLATGGLDPRDQNALRNFITVVRRAHSAQGGGAIGPSDDINDALGRLTSAVEAENAKLGVATRGEVGAAQTDEIGRVVRNQLNFKNFLIREASGMPRASLGLIVGYMNVNLMSYSHISLRALGAVDEARDQFSNTLAASVALSLRNKPNDVTGGTAVSSTIMQVGDVTLSNWLHRRGELPSNQRPNAGRWFASAGLWQAASIYTGYLAGGITGLVAGGGDPDVARYYAQQSAYYGLSAMNLLQMAVTGVSVAALASVGVKAAAAGAAVFATSMVAGHLASSYGYGITASFATAGALAGGTYGSAAGPLGMALGALGGAVAGGIFGYLTEHKLLKDEQTDDPALARKLQASAQTRTGSAFLTGTNALAATLNLANSFVLNTLLTPPDKNGKEVMATRMGTGSFGAVSGAMAGGAIGSFIPGVGSLIGAAVGALAGFVLGATYSTTTKSVLRSFVSLLGYMDRNSSPDVHQLYNPSQATGYFSPSSNPSIWQMPLPGGSAPGSGYYFARMSPVYIGHTVDAISEQYRMQQQYTQSENSMALLNHLLPREMLENRPEFPTETHMSTPVDPYGESYAMFKSLSTTGPGVNSMLVERAIALQKAYTELESAKGTHWGYTNEENPLLTPSMPIKPDDIALAAGLGPRRRRHHPRAGHRKSGAIPGEFDVDFLHKKFSIMELGKDVETNYDAMPEEERRRRSVSHDGQSHSIFASPMLVTSGFAMRKHPIDHKTSFHRAVDVVPSGTGDNAADIVSPVSGTVVYAGRSGGLGNFISVQTELDGVKYLIGFAHMKHVPAMKAGETVKPGAFLGEMGESGYAHGPHVHLTVQRYNAKTKEYTDYLDPRTSGFFGPNDFVYEPSKKYKMPTQKGHPADAITQYDQLLFESAKANQIDWRMLKALMLAESDGNPESTSYVQDRKGRFVRDKRGKKIPLAMGLMQFTATTGAYYGMRSDAERRDPRKSIAGGAQYLSSLIREFGDPKLALAAYNAGPNAVERSKRVDPVTGAVTYGVFNWKETKTHQKRVYQNYDYLIRKYRFESIQPRSASEYESESSATGTVKTSYADTTTKNLTELAPPEPQGKLANSRASEQVKAQLLAEVPALTSEVARVTPALHGSKEATRRQLQNLQIRARVTVAAQQPAVPNSLVDHNKPLPAKPTQVTVRTKENELEVSYHAPDGWISDCLIDYNKEPSRSRAQDPFIHEYQARGHCA